MPDLPEETLLLEEFPPADQAGRIIINDPAARLDLTVRMEVGQHLAIQHGLGLPVAVDLAQIQYGLSLNPG